MLEVTDSVLCGMFVRILCGGVEWPAGKSLLLLLMI